MRRYPSQHILRFDHPRWRELKGRRLRRMAEDVTEDVLEDWMAVAGDAPASP